MKTLRPLRVAMLTICACSALIPCFGQSSSLPKIGVGIKISSLGAGIEAATAVTRRSNVRFGFNAFQYDYDFTQDGIDYGAQLHLRSATAQYDWFMGGFHVSPGVMIYNGNRATGSASVAGGRTFTLGDHDYVSDPANPVKGTAEIDFSKNKVNPMVTIGFGNLLPRSSRHFSVSFEAGVVFGSSPKAALGFAGGTCSSPGVGCQNIANNAQVQSDITSEQNKINNGTPPYDGAKQVFKYYPVISLGFGYKFK